MPVADLNAAPLVEEYKTLVLESTHPRDDEIDWEALRQRLAGTAEWTDIAAAHLVDLARNYGAFMLRNALALAVAAEIDDGDIGF